MWRWCRSHSPIRRHPKKPAVIVSNGAYNASRADVILMAITSHFRAIPESGEVWLDQWQNAGLLKPSVVKPVFTTIEQSLVIRILGTLALEDQRAVRTAIHEIMG